MRRELRSTRRAQALFAGRGISPHCRLASRHRLGGHFHASSGTFLECARSVVGALRTVTPAGHRGRRRAGHHARPRRTAGIRQDHHDLDGLAGLRDTNPQRQLRRRQRHRFPADLHRLERGDHHQAAGRRHRQDRPHHDVFRLPAADGRRRAARAARSRQDRADLEAHSAVPGPGRDQARRAADGRAVELGLLAPDV